jgi:hypothetical protein
MDFPNLWRWHEGHLSISHGHLHISHAFAGNIFAVAVFVWLLYLLFKVLQRWPGVPANDALMGV